MAEWPAHGQKAPDDWDGMLRSYIDEGDRLAPAEGGTVVLDDALPEYTLRGFRVKADTTFTSVAGEVTLEPGVYTFERTASGWTYYVAEGTALVVPPPAPTWVTLATDDFTAPDDTLLIGRTTTTGGLTYVDRENNSPDIRIRGNKATYEAFGYGNTVRLILPSQNREHLRVSLDYNFYGVQPQTGSLVLAAGVDWQPHATGITLDQNGTITNGGNVSPTDLTGNLAGNPKSGRLQIEWASESFVVRINDVEVATAGLGNAILRGEVIDIGFGSNAVSVDNLLIETIGAPA